MKPRIIFDIITLFPEIFTAYLNESVIGRAIRKGLVKVRVHNLRGFTTAPHHKADDRPYGGGPGMVIKIEPLIKAVQSLKSKIKNQKSKLKGKSKKVRVILFSAKGKPYAQEDARRLAQYEQIIMICGRYEGVDERVAERIADEELSVGNFVLTGGEIPAMIVVDAVSRLVPGVLGKEASLKDESFCREGYREYPQYTRPEKFKKWGVPEVLLGGNHKEIEEWRKEKCKM